MANDAWETVPPLEMDTVQRGADPADIAAALRRQRPHRASGELAYRVLDVMECIERSARDAVMVSVDSTCSKPARADDAIKVPAGK